MLLFNKQDQKGFSLLELILAIAIFAIGSVATGYLIIDAGTGSQLSIQRAQATLIAREGLEAVMSIRDRSYSNLLTARSYGLTFSTSTNSWSFSTDLYDTQDGVFKRSVSLTLNPGLEPSLQNAIVTSRVSWKNIKGNDDSVTLITRLYNWHKN